MKAVLMLTEGGGQSGYGHVTRCRSIAQAFEAIGIKTNLVVQPVGDNMPDSFFEDTIPLRWIEEPSLLEKYFVDEQMLLVDSYLADENLYHKLAGKNPIMAFIDDHSRINYPPGILINSAISAENIDCTGRDKEMMILGPRFQPLRSAFRDILPGELKDDIENILIMMGGSDNHNITPGVIAAVFEASSEYQINVIATSSYSNLAEIKQLSRPNMEMYIDPDVSRIIKLMSEADLAISAGGQTLYELARVGTSVIVVGTAENQSTNINGWLEQGFIEYAGWWDSKELYKNIRDKIFYLKPLKSRKNKFQLGRSVIDGQGAGRLAKRILEIIDENPVSFQ